MKLIKKYFPYNILFVLFLIILYFSPICGDDWGNYLVGKMGLFTDIKNAVGMYFVWDKKEGEAYFAASSPCEHKTINKKLLSE